MPKKITPDPSAFVSTIDFPHKRVSGWKWVQELPGKKEFSRQRLEFYAAKLIELGMPEEDIQCMFSDLYWDSYFECVGNGTFKKLDQTK